ncbi:MAG: bile acid:sodium symporter family protein [Intestinimonas sp.]|jgi:predicted Na+-dependent transporter|nr:bile acid:sodium symporter family protein [Intestinimonas sp.]
MRILEQFNLFMEKWIPLVTPCCLLLGVLFPDITGRGVPYVPYVFAFMSFTGGLNSTFRDIKNMFRNPAPFLTTLLILHVIMPLASFGVGCLAFSTHLNMVIGMVLEFIVPSAVTGIMWVSIYHGDSALSLSIVVLDTLITPFTIPLTLKLLLGVNGEINVRQMIMELLLMIALPALAAMILNQATHNETKEKLPRKLAPFSKLCLIFVVCANSSKVAPYMRHMTVQLFAVAMVILLLAMLGYALGWLAGRLLRRKDETIISMTFGSGMRNISAGAVLAAAYFPAETMFPVMIGTLFQQVLAAFYGALLQKFQHVVAEQN